MHYLPLGNSGLKISPLCLGTMMFGGPTDEPTSLKIIADAKDRGINFIDTADAYTGGESEIITGKAIAPHRHHWILATKLANPTQRGPNGRGTSRRHIQYAIEASLKRLNTDCIDLLYLHKEDPTTPLTETVRALADAIRAGKIRYVGLSNYRVWRVAEIAHLCDAENIDRPIANQPLYNILNRQIETELLPACGYYGQGVVPYSPIARGVLTGKYRPDAAPDENTRAGRADKRMMESEFRPESLRIAQTIAIHASARGITPGQFAIAWVLNNKFISSAIAGPRTLEQWQDYQGALTYKFTPEDEALIDSLVAPGHPSTPGFNDPAYPLEGRIPR